MTNLQIITAEAIAKGIFTEEQALAIIEEYGSLPIHTFAIWKGMGYSVKKGEHAAITTTLWKCKIKENDNGEKEKKMIMTKAYLFTAEQVEKIAKKTA